MRDILLKILEAVEALAPAETTESAVSDANRMETKEETPVEEPEVKTTKRGGSK